jgi:hypothetical protein
MLAGGQSSVMVLFQLDSMTCPQETTREVSGVAALVLAPHKDPIGREFFRERGKLPDGRTDERVMELCAKHWKHYW